MRRAISTWWTYGRNTRWGWRDYLRHFGFVAGGFTVAACHALAVLSNT